MFSLHWCLNSGIILVRSSYLCNLLTFNPGWDSDAQPFEPFDDVRDIQRRLKAAGVALSSEADETTTGPASITLADPDGNQILIDQHR